MFTERSLSPALDAVREEHAPGALVVDVERDFETLPPEVAEELSLLTDSLDLLTYPSEWVPADAPQPLHRLAGGEFTVGMPGDGGVTWTRQTDPPVVFVKARMEGSPESFVDFLVAEALVQAGLDLPEHFLGFFEDRYPDLAAATGDRLDPAGTYQLAAALYEAYVGLHTRPVFEGWDSTRPALYDAWADAGQRLRPRLADLASEVATGQTDFSAAAELACAAVKHAGDSADAVAIPTPFRALDSPAYLEYGADFAVQWAEKTFEKL
ncbi:hypothetical protein VB773_04160 [Haloarculaceae archaeon H-GB2-1]|nr:hypothetical protein [Haloarculaceae archaeon H-GB1-1]MEA5406850.1 hypothetical protein [Haloarculaceae archaeon H-GB2-1]